MFKKILVVAALGMTLMAGSCDDDAKIAEANIIKASDNFETNRRIVFLNTWTGEYELLIEGPCSFDQSTNGMALNVICKVGPNQYKRHTQLLTGNMSVTVEQVDPIKASPYHYRVTFKPQAILPDIDFRGDAKELTTNTAK